MKDTSRGFFGACILLSIFFPAPFSNQLLVLFYF